MDFKKLLCLFFFFSSALGFFFSCNKGDEKAVAGNLVKVALSSSVVLFEWGFKSSCFSVIMKRKE